MADSEIQSFRDLDAWKVAMDLAVLVYNTAKLLPHSETYGLGAQLRRAAVSVPSNIAEGQSCGKNGRYMNHVRIALGSLGELATGIELALRLGYLSAMNAASVDTHVVRTRQLVFGLLRSLRRQRLRRAVNGLALLGVWMFQVVVLG